MTLVVLESNKFLDARAALPTDFIVPSLLTFDQHFGTSLQILETTTCGCDLRNIAVISGSSLVLLASFGPRLATTPLGCASPVPRQVRQGLFPQSVDHGGGGANGGG